MVNTGEVRRFFICYCFRSACASLGLSLFRLNLIQQMTSFDFFSVLKQEFCIFVQYYVVLTFFITLHFFLPCLKIPFSRVLERSVCSHLLVLFCVHVFVQSCTTVTCLLYIEFASRNLIRREDDDAMVLIIRVRFP